jgi:hypothetical protein
MCSNDQNVPDNSHLNENVMRSWNRFITFHNTLFALQCPHHYEKLVKVHIQYTHYVIIKVIMMSEMAVLVVFHLQEADKIKNS